MTDINFTGQPDTGANALALRNCTPQQIAEVMAQLLEGQIRNLNAPAFYLWARPDRAIISVDPSNLRSQQAIDYVLNPRFQHALKTILGGVPVVKTNTRGIFYQVGYTPTPPAKFDSIPLNMAEQPSPLHVPIGVTAKGVHTWVSIMDLGSVLIAGARRKGKTRFVHGWIQSLLAGRACELWMYDGKDGLEFSCYEGQDGIFVIGEGEKLVNAIRKLREIANYRGGLFKPMRATSLQEYNDRVAAEQRVRPIILFIDEVAIIPPEVQDEIGQLIALTGAHGILPVLATQRTSGNEVSPLIKTNLVSRFCFKVPAVADSMVALTHPDAARLPNIPGRLVTQYDGVVATFQAFEITLPGAPKISGKDIDLARWAVENHNGRMSIPKLVAERKMTDWEARQLLDTWQARGWLEGAGNGVARRVTPALEGLITRSQGTTKVEGVSQGSSQGSLAGAPVD